MSITTIHVVHKTHLDVGFTGYAADVAQQYVDVFIPAAIQVADALENAGGPERFIWTTGSWLITHALSHGTPAQRETVDRAIRQGKLTWHGLPFTTHTELMTSGLFEHGLSLAANLDAIYGHRTISSKMTDVPGHTVGMVPSLQRAGIRYLHIGINPASALPDVPPHFRWRSPDGSEVITTYDADYGTSDERIPEPFPGQTDALYMAFTNDNLGPPSADDVVALFARLRERYPNAHVRASTLDAFAETLLPHAATLPVVDEEIGDTWIHGPAGDPILLSQFRRLQALRERWITDGRLERDSAESAGFSDSLLLIAEHTWGRDVKSSLPDYVNYTKRDFSRARDRDTVDARITPDIYAYALQWLSPHPERPYSYSGLERSWQEQRDYATAAIDSLPASLQREARAELDDSTRRRAVPASARSGIGGVRRLGQFAVEFGFDGSLTSVVGTNGRVHADQDHPIGQYVYQTYCTADYQRWLRDYGRDLRANAAWAFADHGKLGLDVLDDVPPAGTYHPHVTGIAQWEEDGHDIARVSAVMPDDACEERGAPREVELTYTFDHSAPTISVQLRLSGKDAYRLPEASWMRIAPLVDNPNRWNLRKLGSLVDPGRVVRNGNRTMHSVEAIEYANGIELAEIVSVDAPLVALGRPGLLQFDNTFNALDDGFYFNLHNNVWGTNFRMWFDEDVAFEFELTLDAAAEGHAV